MHQCDPCLPYKGSWRAAVLPDTQRWRCKTHFYYSCRHCYHNHGSCTGDVRHFNDKESQQLVQGKMPRSNPAQWICMLLIPYLQTRMCCFWTFSLMLCFFSDHWSPEHQTRELCNDRSKRLVLRQNTSKELDRFFQTHFCPKMLFMIRNWNSPKLQKITCNTPK